MSARPLGQPFIVTGTDEVGDRQRRIHYLLADGRRRSQVIDVADDSPLLRQEIGQALAERRRRYNPARSRRQP